MICYINGEFCASEEASISIRDLGFLRGYGIFDYMKCIGEKIMFLDDHLERFYRSAAYMKLEIPLEEGQLTDTITELIRLNELPVSGIKMILTGGDSPDGYRPGKPNFIITMEPLGYYLPDLEARGIRATTFEYQRFLPEIKTTNYVMGVLKTFMEPGAADDVLFHNGQFLSEFPRSNVFLVDSGDRIATPDKGVLQGITRKQIIQNPEVRVEVRPVRVNELASAKEVFLTGTGKRIIPIASVDDFSYGDGRPGPVTQTLMNWFVEQEQQLIRSPQE